MGNVIIIYIVYSQEKCTFKVHVPKNKTKQNKTKQNKTKQNKTKQNKTKQKAKQNKNNNSNSNKNENKQANRLQVIYSSVQFMYLECTMPPWLCNPLGCSTLYGC